MGRIPCCDKDDAKRGKWTPEEDSRLSSYIVQHGTHNWRLIAKNAGLHRCGKSCKLRWTNFLRPDLKHSDFLDVEDHTIVKLHSIVGNRWSLIAAQLPGRTDNDVKNHWNTKLKKKLSEMGIDHVTHKPFSHLMAEIATALAPPQVANFEKAALGGFKDEMLHILIKKRVDSHTLQSDQTPLSIIADPYCTAAKSDEKYYTMETTKPLSEEHGEANCAWSFGDYFAGSVSGYQHSPFILHDEGVGSPWSQSMWSGSMCTAGNQDENLNQGKRDESQFDINSIRRESSASNTDCVLWDFPYEDLINSIV